jgi:hypothetical protein
MRGRIEEEAERNCTVQYSTVQYRLEQEVEQSTTHHATLTMKGTQDKVRTSDRQRESDWNTKCAVNIVHSVAI